MELILLYVALMSAIVTGMMGFTARMAEAQRVRCQAREVVQETALRMVRQVSETLPPPTPSLAPDAIGTTLDWVWCAEREAFGMNDTDRLIKRIDTELRRPT